MRIKFDFRRCLVLLVFISYEASSQSAFNGLLVTNEDSVIRGYMRISLDERGKKFEITQDKKKKPAVFYSNDLKYYAFKKDTFAFLNAFYPFRGEDYLAQGVEAKILIRRGRVKLYQGVLPEYGKRFEV